MTVEKCGLFHIMLWDSW